jgi:hypothetical protein
MILNLAPKGELPSYALKVTLKMDEGNTAQDVREYYPFS